MEKNPHYLKIHQVLFLMILAITINLILAALGMFYLTNIYNNYILYFLAVINTISFGSVIFIGIKIIKLPVKEIFTKKKSPKLLILSIFITCIGLAIIVSEIDNIFQKYFPMNDELSDFFMNLFKTKDILGSILVLSIVAPITEELFFRGIIFKSFLNQYNLKFSIILSSLLFGLIHLNPWQFLGSSLLGIYLSWIYYETENLFTPILAHSFFNGIPILLTKFAPMEIEGLTKKSKSFSLQPLCLDISGIVLLISGIALTHVILKKSRNINCSKN